jgi:hypothetical protein
MITSSILMGVLIAFYFVFINSEYLRVASPNYLPYTFIGAGISGYLLSMFNTRLEKAIGFKWALFSINSLVALSLFTIWYLHSVLKDVELLVILSYSWFWTISNVIILSFWKIPTRLFNIEENKKFNSRISLGEVFSAILVYLLIIPLSRKFGILNTVDYMLIAGISCMLFASIFLFIKEEKRTLSIIVEGKSPISESHKTNLTSLLKNPLFKHLFFSIILAMIVQLLVDFSLLNITKEYANRVGNIATFFAVVYGFMRIIELLFKLLVANNIVKQYGIFGSFYAMIFSIGLVYIIGLISQLISESLGMVALILAIAAIGKVIERSINRAMYLPSQNVLFQAYEKDLRTHSQNYSEGYGKPLGLILSGLLMMIFIIMSNFNLKIILLFCLLIAISILWYYNTVKLKKGYHETLKLRIENMTNTATHESKSSNTNYSEFNQAYQKDLFVLPEIESICASYNTKHKNTEFMNGIAQLAIELNNPATQKLFFKQEVSYPELIKFLKNAINQGISVYEFPIISILFTDNDLLNEVLKPLYSSMNTYQIEDHIYYYERWFSRFQHHTKYICGLNNLKVILYHEKTIQDEKDVLRELTNEKAYTISSVIKHLPLNGLNSEELNNDYSLLLKKLSSLYSLTLSCIYDLQDVDNPKIHFLLKSELNEIKLAILAALTIKYNKAQIIQIKGLLLSGTRENKLIGLEMLELIIDSEDSLLISPIFKNLSEKETLYHLEKEFPKPHYDLSNRLRAIVLYHRNEFSYATRVCALNELLSNPELKIVTEDLYFLSFSSEQIIKHLALNSLKEIGREGTLKFCEQFNDDRYKALTKIPLILQKDRNDFDYSLELSEQINMLYDKSYKLIGGK